MECQFQKTCVLRTCVLLVHKIIIMELRLIREEVWDPMYFVDDVDDQVAVVQSDTLYTTYVYYILPTDCEQLAFMMMILLSINIIVF